MEVLAKGDQALSTQYLDLDIPRGKCACCGRKDVFVLPRLSVLDFKSRRTCDRCLDNNVEAEAAAIAIYQGDGKWSGADALVLDAVLIHDPDAEDGYSSPMVWATHYDARKVADAARKKAASAQARRAKIEITTKVTSATSGTVSAPKIEPLADDDDDTEVNFLRGIIKKLPALPAMGAIMLVIATLAGSAKADPEQATYDRAVEASVKLRAKLMAMQRTVDRIKAAPKTKDACADKSPYFEYALM